MARKRRGRLVNGILVLDKPNGMSSNHALQRAKRLFDAAKAGHTGSLDPLATGVLPLCFGEATKFSRFLLDADKAYTSTFVLGVKTASGDAEGEVLERCDASQVTEQDVQDALAGFRGEIEQVPSMYSAIKHQGKPLYALEHITRIDDNCAVDWPYPPQGQGCHQVLITGSPNLEVSVHGHDPVEPGLAGGGNSSAAAWLVNAIPAVCDARAGVVTVLDLPRFTGAAQLRVS